MTETEHRPPPPSPRPKRRRVLAVAALALVALAAGWVVMLALTGRPVSLPDLVVARIEARANALLGGQARAELGGVVLVLDRGFAPHVALRDVRLFSATGTPLALLPDLRARLDRAALLRGRVVPQALTISGARVALHRLRDGSLDLSLDTPALPQGALTPAQVLDRIDAAFSAPGLASIRTIGVDRLEMRLFDDRTNQVWQVSSGTLNLAQNRDQIGIGMALNVAEGGLDPARIEVSFLSRKDSAEARLHARVRDVNSRDLAAQTPALAFLAALDTRLSGRIDTGLAADGSLAPMTASLDLGPGALRPTHETRPIGFNSARVELTYDPLARRIDFTRLAVDSPALRVSAGARAWFGRLNGAFPASLTAQLHIDELKADPQGLFEKPVVFSRGAADVKIDLDPFRVTIGQLMLIDAGRHIGLSGTIAAGQGGWNVATDVAIDAIDTDRLLALWPLAAVPKTRAWLAENVATGELYDVKAALRMRPGAEPRLTLGYEYRAAEVRFLRSLPPVKDGAGYSTINDNAYTLVVDRGRVTAPQGGDIDVTGSVLEVPEIRAKPAPMRITLHTDSTVTAALALLDQPPFGFMTKAGRPVDIAEGRARMDAVLELPLKKKVQPEEVSYDVTGRLDDVRSDRIVPGRPLAAPSLEVRATRAGLKISGRGTLGGIPFDAGWQQLFGPANKGRSTVEGFVQLSPAFADAFAIGLPKGMVGGKGWARIALDLRQGTDTAFRMESDLKGLRLQIPAVGWVKEAGAKGRLAVTGTLGRPAAISALELEGAGLSATGAVALRPDGALDRARFAKVTLGGWFDGGLDLVGRGKGAPPGVEITGGRLALAGASFGRGAATAAGGPVKVALDRLQVTDGIALAGFRGDFVTAGGFRGTFTGAVNGEVPVSGVVAPVSGGSGFRIRGEDAGAAMRAAGLFTRGRGGNLDLVLNPDGGPGRYRGRVVMRDLRVVNMPVLAELLGAISVVGLLEQLNGAGILFAKTEADFRILPGAVEISRGAAVGASMGVSAEGVYRTGTRAFDLQGTISPIYLLNGIGQIFSRRGEGLFGFNYRITGPADAPRVAVNPLSILTPGMFREIFRAEPPRAGD